MNQSVKKMSLFSSNNLETTLPDYVPLTLMTVYKPALRTFVTEQNVSKGRPNVDPQTILKSNMQAQR